MDHQRDAVLSKAERLGGARVVDLVHDTQFYEVVPGAQSPDLVQSALDGPWSDVRRIGGRETPALLGMVEVRVSSEALPDCPRGALGHDLVELALPELAYGAARADPTRDVPEERPD